MRTLLGGLAISLGLYLVLLILIYIFQRSFLYIPDQQVPSELHLSEMDFSAVAISLNNGTDLKSLWRAPTDNGKPVIIHFHGNAGSQYARIPLYQAMALDGAGVLGVGYPGYGGNAGDPTEDLLYQTAQAHYDWLIEQGYSPKQIVIVGQSLGSGVATWLASNNDAAGLILEAAYTGMDDMAQRQFPIFPARLLVKDRFRSLDRIGNIDMPLSWIHGTRDELIPYAMGELLFDGATQPKVAHAIKGGGHNDLWQRGIDQIIRRDAEQYVAGG